MKHIFHTCIICHFFVLCILGNPSNQRWRIDENYDGWTLEGSFMLGTPSKCLTPLPPHNGRWVCSVGPTESDRNLCMVDCKKDYVMEYSPEIYNCENNSWKSFPIPDRVNIIPFGNCISMMQYRLRKRNRQRTNILRSLFQRKRQMNNN